MPLLSVEQYIRDDGKLEIRVRNCSGARAVTAAINEFTASQSEWNGDLVFQSGSQDDEQPCAIIFSLRSSQPHHFYFRGGVAGTMQCCARTHLSPGLVTQSSEEARAAVVALSEQEWGARGFSSVAPPTVSHVTPSSHSRGQTFEDASMGHSANSSIAFTRDTASSGGWQGLPAASDRPLIVREEIPDGVLLPGERRTFVLDLDDPQGLREYFQARVAVREKDTRLHHHHHHSHQLQDRGNKSGSRPVPPKPQTPKQRRATALPKPSPNTPPRLPQERTPVSGAANVVSDACSSSFEPTLVRATTAAFNADSPTSAVKADAKPVVPVPQRPQRPLGSPGLLDSRAPPGRWAPHPHRFSTDDDDEEDELTTSAVPYSRMTIRVDSEPATSPARDSRPAAPGRRPSAPAISDGDDEDASSPSRHRIDDNDPTLYPTEHPPPPTVSSRLNNVRASPEAARDAGRDPSTDWDGSLRDSSVSSFSAPRDSHPPSTPSAADHTTRESAAQSAFSSAAVTTPPPMLYVYYSRLGDENKCVERARKWLKRESKSYKAWQDNFIKTAVKLEKRRQDAQLGTRTPAMMGSADNLSSLPGAGRVNSSSTFGGGGGSADHAPCTRLLPPALGDPVRWRRETHARTERTSADAFSNTALARCRAAYGRYYGPVIQEEVGSARVAEVIVAYTVPYAATHTNAVSKEAQKMFRPTRLGDGVVAQPLRWQLFVPPQPHRRHPLITPRAGTTEPQLTSPSSTLWHGDHSHSSSQSQRLLSSWPPPQDDSTDGHTPNGRGTYASPVLASAGIATVPRRDSLSLSVGESDRRDSPRQGPFFPGSAVGAGRGLALLDDSVSASGMLDHEMDGMRTPGSAAPTGLVVSADGPLESRVTFTEPTHSRGNSSASPPMHFDATHSFLPPVGLARTETLDPTAADALGHSLHAPDRDDSVTSEQSTHSDFVSAPLIAFSNAPRSAKDKTLWGSLMSTGSRSAGVMSPLTADDHVTSPQGSLPPPQCSPRGLAARLTPVPSATASSRASHCPNGSPVTSPVVTAMESSQRSQGPPAAGESGIVNASFSRINTYLQSYLAARNGGGSGGGDGDKLSGSGHPQSATYPTEETTEFSFTSPPLMPDSSGLISPLEDSTFGLSSQHGMRQLTTAPPSSLLKRPSPMTSPLTGPSAPRRGQAYLEERAMRGGALGTIALTVSLLMQLAALFARRLHDLLGPIAGQVVNVLAEQMPSLVSGLWDFLVDVVLADENVALIQKFMVPTLGVMGLWLVTAMVWSSGSSLIAESDFDGPL